MATDAAHAAARMAHVAAGLAASLDPEEQAWLVGGAVRDLILGDPSSDFDVAVRGDAERLARRFADGLDGAFFTYSQVFSTFRVVLPDGSIDVSPLRGGDLAADLAGRDFTVNAIALPVAPAAALSQAPGAAWPAAGGLAGKLSRLLVDPLHGSDDLADRRLRTCSPSAFRDDPVRVLRLARMGAGWSLAADGPVMASASAAVPGLQSCSAERQAHEMTALLGLPQPDVAVRLLDDVGALEAVLPEMSALKGCDQNPYHHLDVFGHTLEALAHLNPIVRQLGGEGLLVPPEACGLPGAARSAPLAWAVLLHDIGKPVVRRVGEEGQVIFWRHDELGALMAEEIAARLHMSRRFGVFLRTLVLNHLRLGFLSREVPLTQRALVRYRRAVEPYVFESVVLSLADRMATRGEKTSGKAIARHFRLARLVWLQMPRQSRPLPLDGRDVMDLLGIDEGPVVGEAIAFLREEVDAGEVAGADDARALLLDWWREREAADA